MENLWIWVWVGIILLTIIVELITVGLTSVWMTCGALVALVLALLEVMPSIQIIAFFVVSFVLLFFTRPWAIKHLERKRILTNYEAIIGQEVRVLETVENDKDLGKVMYNGMEWTARALEKSQIFEVDEVARVQSISGVKLILEKLDKTP